MLATHHHPLHKMPISLQEIVAVSTVSKKEISRVFTRILEAHQIELDIIQPGDFMSRFCGMLKLPQEVQKAATHIAKRADDLDLVQDRSPMSVAAAAIYMASQASSDKKTRREIANVAGIADVTLRQSYKLFLPRATELFPDGFNFATPIENLPQN